MVYVAADDNDDADTDCESDGRGFSVPDRESDENGNANAVSIVFAVGDAGGYKAFGRSNAGKDPAACEDAEAEGDDKEEFGLHFHGRLLIFRTSACESRESQSSGFAYFQDHCGTWQNCRYRASKG